MKPLPIIATLLLCLSWPNAAHANLGETEAQCIKRYGPEFDIREPLNNRQVGDRAASFHFKTASGSLDIRITFLNGASCHEAYSNSDSSQGLTMARMKALLDAQSAGLEWRKGKSVFRTPNISGQTYGSTDWLRSDGATARIWISGKADSQEATGQIELSTRQYTDAQREFDRENGSP